MDNLLFRIFLEFLLFRILFRINIFFKYLLFIVQPYEIKKKLQCHIYYITIDHTTHKTTL